MTIEEETVDALPDCKFTLEIVDKCPKCGGYHPRPKKKSKWHNTRDKLPNNDHMVLVQIEGHIEMGQYLNKLERWYIQPIYSPWYQIDGTFILFWRELPKPPKKAKNHGT